MAKGASEQENHEIETVEDFERELSELNKILMGARDLHVPKVKASPYMWRWWSTELGQKRKEVAKLAQKAYAEGKKGCISHDIHEEHRKARNEYSQMIKLAKKEHFLDWLERVDPSKIWDLHKFTSSPASDGGKARIPTLKILDKDGKVVEIDGDEEKAKLLHATFFTPQPENLQLPKNPEYPEPCMEMQDNRNSS